ncbi:hypothetical protein MHU86_20620 [Fragilaria crotonensis]|nr:hypothetical protein MHU86_20620 [Fragilaria crotonensis]
MNSGTNLRHLVAQSLIAGTTLMAATTTIYLSCWVIDPDETHFVDIHVGVVGIPDRESVVLVRNVTKIDAHDDHLELLERLTTRCREIRVSGAKGTARAKSADVGSMFALGTRIETMESSTGPPVYSKIPYEFGFVTRGRDSSFRNHLYGTFTAAKEKIVKAGRALCAAGYCPPGATSPAGSKRAGRKRQNKRRRRPRRRGGPRVETGGAAATKPGWQAGELASAEAAVELLASGLPLCSEGSDAVRRFHSGKRERDVGDSPSPADGREDGAVGGGGGELHSGSRKPNVAVSAGTPCVGGRKVDGQPAGDSLTFGGWRVQITDLEVGGRYKIPKKKNKHVQL